MTDREVVPLQKGYKFGAFTCGNEPLDTWLMRSALPDGGEGNNRTHLWLDCESKELLGYFTLTPAVVTDNPLTGQRRPAILLAKLAIAQHLQGQEDKQGHKLLYAAFEVVVQAVGLVGGRYLAVDPQTEGLVPYYENLGFEVVESEGGLRMIQKISSIRKALQQQP
ncbi:hypothetical protein [Terrabacter sp. BE26]|uniref:hypothetical protein n=1 Tax=Terrabacter sp. BE26 TaxID=2898152 RepID=UPI0035BE8E5B